MPEAGQMDVEPDAAVDADVDAAAEFLVLAACAPLMGVVLTHAVIVMTSKGGKNEIC